MLLEEGLETPSVHEIPLAACFLRLKASVFRDSAAAQSSAVSSLPSPGFHLKSSIVFWSHSSASPSSKPCSMSLGSSKSPS